MGLLGLHAKMEKKNYIVIIWTDIRIAISGNDLFIFNFHDTAVLVVLARGRHKMHLI